MSRPGVLPLGPTPGNVLSLDAAMRLVQDGLLRIEHVGIAAGKIYEHCFPAEFAEMQKAIAESKT